MAEELPRRSLNTEPAGGHRAHSLFFTPENEGQDFNTVLQDVQEYISGKYSALITEGGDEDAKAQIKRYITKYVQDRRIAVKGYSSAQLVDALYTEMAEFGLLTKYKMCIRDSRMQAEYGGPDLARYQVVYDGAVGTNSLDGIWEAFCRKPLGSDGQMCIRDRN